MRERLPYLAFGLALTVGLHVLFNFPLGLTALALFVGWPLLGTFVTADDDLPGGWSNPDGSIRPPWKRAFYWGHIAVGFAIAFAAFAIDAGWLTQLAAVFWLLAFAACISSFLLLRSTL